MLLLYVEILKATRMSSKAIMDHVLSLVLFIAMVIEFIAVQRAATSTFLILLALSFVDVIGGFTITIRTAQRDIEIDRPGMHGARLRRIDLTSSRAAPVRPRVGRGGRVDAPPPRPVRPAGAPASAAPAGRWR